MPHRTATRCLLLSLTSALVGAVGLALSGGSPVADLGPAAATAASAPVAEVRARAVPDLPAALPAAALGRQARAGLTCATSLAAVTLCTHPASAAAAGAGTTTPRGGTLGCYGDGTSGPRVRAVYARPRSGPDRYDASVPAIREWAAGISRQFDASAAVTDGRRHVRYATTPGRSCTLLVREVVLPDEAFRSFRATIDALQAHGLTQAWTKYLVWSDGSGYCGMATTYADDSPGLDNLNNGSAPAYSRVDRACWGKAETHELVHMLGGVQPSAPHGTGSFHCSDGLDALCYDDGAEGSRQRQVCSAERSQLLDCRNDDYYSTAAPRGSYLQTHWNTARSSFLSSTLSDAPPTDAKAPAPAASPTATARPTASPDPVVAPPPLPRPALLPSLKGLVRLPTPSPLLPR